MWQPRRIGFSMYELEYSHTAMANATWKIITHIFLQSLEGFWPQQLIHSPFSFEQIELGNVWVRSIGGFFAQFH